VEGLRLQAQKITSAKKRKNKKEKSRLSARSSGQAAFYDR